ncbi:Coenzyme F420 hydrogenase/dehydrogenase, beta subunit C-terminal domain [Maribacter luteus]|uniref:Coenzyme F420 hydrogenase/dehydrogenase, beta subunit C-terminal domain n=1 Tax=Maribacter luteus TaxID=2594478 RepID=UPI0031EA8BF4
MYIPKVISQVVDQDLCTGCGICIAECTSKSIKMDWNTNGFLVPNQTDKDCTDEGSCIKVCPFNPFPKPEVRTEDEIAAIFQNESQKFDSKLGKYESIYVGYSLQYRKTSSSGGLATYFLIELFDRRIVDAVIVVNYNANDAQFYNYKLIKSKDDILAASKTRYYPVTLEGALSELNDFNGKVAIVGVGCFIKAVRLKQYENPIFSSKVAFLIGIICGGLKSKYYTDYLASKIIGTYENIDYPEYRIKKPENEASDYYFGLDYKKEKHELRMRDVGDMWGTGFFKSNACDFCEDVTSELADVSLGDAWLKPYVQEGDGNSIIISRNKLAERILREGKNQGKLDIETLDNEDVKLSQRGSFNHRQKGLAYRIGRRTRKGKLTPPKRERNLQEVNFYFRLVQFFRQRTRTKTIDNWNKTKNAITFEKKMNKELLVLRIVTKIYHLTRKS